MVGGCECACANGTHWRSNFSCVRHPSALLPVSLPALSLVVAKENQRAVITVMPMGKPLIDVIEEELVSASEMPGEQQPRQTGAVVKGMSQLALGLKAMHEKNVYWRDCKVDRAGSSWHARPDSCPQFKTCTVPPPVH